MSYCEISKTGAWLGTELIKLPHIHDSALAAALADMLDGLTVVDLGCGLGDYVKAMESRVKIDGFDGNPNTPELTGGRCGTLDLSEPWNLEEPYDAAMLLEVGEHVPPEHETAVIDNAVKAARKLLVVSWATPGQSGHGHFNCRPIEYVTERFQERGWTLDVERTEVLRNAASVSWFKTNLLVFHKE